MKFEQIISAAGFDAKDYPMLRNIPVEVYDRKNRKMHDEDMTFVKPLFEENLESQKRFEEFLKKEGYESKILPTNIQVRLTEDVLVIYLSGCAPQFFLRFR